MASSTVKTWSRFAKVDFCLASVAREAARTPAGVALLHVHAIAAILTWATPAWLNASLAMHAGKVLSVCKKKKKQKKFVGEKRSKKVMGGKLVLKLIRGEIK